MSNASGPPPYVEGEAVPAASHALHPLWERAAGRGGGDGGRGRGRGRGKGGPGSVNGDARNAISASRYVPISMVELELKRRVVLDGASAVLSDDEDGPSRRKKKKRKKTEDEEGDGVDGAEGGVEEPSGCRALSSDDEEEEDMFGDAENGRTPREDDLMFARAAFGGKGKDKAEKCTALTSTMSDSEDAASMTSSAVRKAHKAAFPISGVRCVGCALPQKVGLIDEFVRSSASRMSEAALYKMAALVYHRDIVEPARNEGVVVPAWSWKDIHAHYTLHYVDPRLQRMENVRSLAAMRKTLELSMLREDEATGERVLDKSNADALMKIVALQSKEIQLLEASSNPKNGDRNQSKTRQRDD